VNIVDWFDIENDEHLRAYWTLGRVGNWPEGFIPNGMQFPPGWNRILESKLADAYLKLKLGKFCIVAMHLTNL
jgi:hypothetical protein